MLNLFQEYSYPGLFLILLAEEGGLPLPLPGDFFIATAAALPGNHYLAIITIVTAATVAGSTLLFTLAKIFGHRLLIKLGKYVKITPDSTKKIEGWFAKYGGMAIVIGRLIPGLRIITPIVAGTFDLSYKKFWVYTTLAALIWANIYFAVGRFFNGLLTKVF